MPLIDGEPLEDEVFYAHYEATRATLGRLVDIGVLTVNQARRQLRESVLKFSTKSGEIR